MKSLSTPALYTVAFLILCLFLPMTGMAQVSADYDTKVDFNKFKTFAWLAPGDSVLNRNRPDKLYCGYIMYAANKELTARGLKMDTLRPDLILVFNTSLQEMTRYSQSPTLSVGVGVMGPGYYVGSSVPVAGGEITSTQEGEGVLSYDMYDTQTKKLVWTGRADKNFLMSEDIELIIGDVTEKIFKKLPRKKVKK